MKKLIIPILLTNLILAECTPQQKREAEMFWKQSTHKDSNPKEKLKILNKAYEKCPSIEKIIVDRYITFVYTLPKKDRESKEIRDNLYDIAMRNQELDVSINHIKNNQKKINILLGKSFDGTLRAVEEAGGVYRADIRFDYNSAVLKKSNLVTKVIDKISSEIEKNPNAIFGLEGGASSEGSASYNKKLSKRRADALKKEILKQNPNFDKNINTSGVGERTLVCEGDFLPEVDEYGETRCITKEDKEASRRVTIRREQ